MGYPTYGRGEKLETELTGIKNDEVYEIVAHYTNEAPMIKWYVQRNDDMPEPMTAYDLELGTKSYTLATAEELARNPEVAEIVGANAKLDSWYMLAGDVGYPVYGRGEKLDTELTNIEDGEMYSIVVRYTSEAPIIKWYVQKDNEMPEPMTPYGLTVDQTEYELATEEELARNPEIPEMVGKNAKFDGWYVRSGNVGDPDYGRSEKLDAKLTGMENDEVYEIVAHYTNEAPLIKWYVQKDNEMPEPMPAYYLELDQKSYTLATAEELARNPEIAEMVGSAAKFDSWYLLHGNVGAPVYGRGEKLDTELTKLENGEMYSIVVRYTNEAPRINWYVQKNDEAPIEMVSYSLDLNQENYTLATAEELARNPEIAKLMGEKAKFDGWYLFNNGRGDRLGKELVGLKNNAVYSIVAHYELKEELPQEVYYTVNIKIAEADKSIAKVAGEASYRIKKGEKLSVNPTVAFLAGNGDLYTFKGWTDPAKEAGNLSTDLSGEVIGSDRTFVAVFEKKATTPATSTEVKANPNTGV